MYKIPKIHFFQKIDCVCFSENERLVEMESYVPKCNTIIVIAKYNYFKGTLFHSLHFS